MPKVFRSGNSSPRPAQITMVPGYSPSQTLTIANAAHTAMSNILSIRDENGRVTWSRSEWFYDGVKNRRHLNSDRYNRCIKCGKHASCVVHAYCSNLVLGAGHWVVICQWHYTIAELDELHPAATYTDLYQDSMSFEEFLREYLE